MFGRCVFGLTGQLVERIAHRGSRVLGDGLKDVCRRNDVLSRGFSSHLQTPKPKPIDEVVKKYAKFHVNPDQYEIKPTKSVPDKIERPMWMRPDMPKKFDNYEGLIRITDPDDLNSRRIVRRIQKSLQDRLRDFGVYNEECQSGNDSRGS